MSIGGSHRVIEGNEPTGLGGNQVTVNTALAGWTHDHCVVDIG
jgi:hypothetical protein